MAFQLPEVVTAGSKMTAAWANSVRTALNELAVAANLTPGSRFNISITDGNLGRGKSNGLEDVPNSATGRYVIQSTSGATWHNAPTTSDAESIVGAKIY